MGEVKEQFGKPEPLKGDLSGYWSRRINDEHRLVYTVKGDDVIFGDESERPAWSPDDVPSAQRLYQRLSPPAREMFDMLIDAPGVAVSGNEIASRLGLENGAHSVAGILAWPGRWSRKLGRAFPIITEGRDDGATDYRMDAVTAAVFAQARKAA